MSAMRTPTVLRQVADPAFKAAWEKTTCPVDVPRGLSVATEQLEGYRLGPIFVAAAFTWQPAEDPGPWWLVVHEPTGLVFGRAGSKDAAVAVAEWVDPIEGCPIWQHPGWPHVTAARVPLNLERAVHAAAKALGGQTSSPAT